MCVYHLALQVQSFGHLEWQKVAWQNHMVHVCIMTEPHGSCLYHERTRWYMFVSWQNHMVHVCITREPGGTCLYHERTRWYMFVSWQNHMVHVCITTEPGGTCLYHERTRWHTVCVPFSVPGVGEVHKEDKLQQQEHKASRHANVHPVWNRPALPYTNYHHAHNGNKTLTITLKQSSKAHNSVIPGLLKIKCVLHMYTVQFMYYITQCIAIQCIA